MDPVFVLIQFLNGLASASALFLVAAGLSLIFGVTRIVNFAHGTLFMLGAFLAYSLSQSVGFWAAVPLAALAVALVGAVMEVGLLRRLYQAPELLQLLATFAVVLVLDDLILLAWGPADVLGPRAPGLEGAVRLLGQPFPAYELFLVAVGPAVLALVWLLLRRTRFGILVRAATLDRQMVAALGVNQKRLFTAVFALGALLAGLGGALQVPRQAIHHGLDLEVIVQAFVVVVVGGLGSVPGAYLAAVLIAELNAFGIVLFPQGTLVLMFLAMAAVLVLRPQGLLGRPEAPEPRALAVEPPPALPRPAAAALAALAVVAVAAAPLFTGGYGQGVLAEILLFALLAASLQFITGLGGMVSFGHAAWFGLGAYAAALLHTRLDAGMAGALLAAPVAAAALALAVGWLLVRLSGVYLAMLTLAVAQILHAAAFQWYGLTGGDNGILGVWPAGWAADSAGFLYLALALCLPVLGLLWWAARTPFGFGLRAGRDSPLRAEAVGVSVRRQRWLGFSLGAAAAGLAGGLYAYLKGSVFPEALGIPVSVDALVMMLLGGIHSFGGAIAGAVAYKLAQVALISATDYWRLGVGLLIIVLVLAFPSGLAGGVGRLAGLMRRRRKAP